MNLNRELDLRAAEVEWAACPRVGPRDARYRLDTQASVVEGDSTVMLSTPLSRDGACRTSLPNVNLGDARLRIKTEMNTTHKLDEVATPEMTAKAWDDYLHRCGPEAYISARYGSVRDITLGPCPDHLNRVAADRSRPVRTGLAQAA